MNYTNPDEQAVIRDAQHAANMNPGFTGTPEKIVLDPGAAHLLPKPAVLPNVTKPKNKS